MARVHGPSTAGAVRPGEGTSPAVGRSVRAATAAGGVGWTRGRAGLAGPACDNGSTAIRGPVTAGAAGARATAATGGTWAGAETTRSGSETEKGADKGAGAGGDAGGDAI